MHGFKIDDLVTKPGYSYYGCVVGFDRKFRQDWVRVSWEGAAFTVRESPSAIALCPVRPARVNPYN